MKKIRIVTLIMVMVFAMASALAAKENAPNTGANAPEVIIAKAMLKAKTMSMGYVSIPIDEDYKNIFVELLLASKLDENLPDEGHAFNHFSLQDSKASVSFGSGASDYYYINLTLKDGSYKKFFAITGSHVPKMDTFAKEAFNKALVSGTSDLDEVVGEYKYASINLDEYKLPNIINSLDKLNILKDYDKESNRKVRLTKQVRESLPTLLLTKQWRLTDNFSFKDVKYLNMILTVDEYSEMLMEFRISNGLYFIVITDHGDFNNVTFEVPKQAFINLGLVDK